jgi:hypothetical protein
MGRDGTDRKPPANNRPLRGNGKPVGVRVPPSAPFETDEVLNEQWAFFSFECRYRFWGEGLMERVRMKRKPLANNHRFRGVNVICGEGIDAST